MKTPKTKVSIASSAKKSVGVKNAWFEKADPRKSKTFLDDEDDEDDMGMPMDDDLGELNLDYDEDDDY